MEILKTLPERQTLTETLMTEEPANPMDKTLMIYPDMILRQSVIKNQVSIFDGRLTKLIIDMLTIMRELSGVGLAAPQIGKRLPIIVYRVDMNEGCMVNPVITDKSGKLIEDLEGCLSMPGVKIKVPRYEKIRVQYQDEDGMNQKLDANHQLARCIQHEVDHLHGKTVLDYLSKLKKDIITRKLQKSSRNYGRYLKEKKKQEYKELKRLSKEFKDSPEFLTSPQLIEDNLIPL